MSALTLPASLLGQLQILWRLTLAANQPLKPLVVEPASCVREQTLKLALCLSSVIMVISPGAVVNCVCAAGQGGLLASSSNYKFTSCRISMITPTT